MKKHEFLMGFRGNIISDVTADTLSGQECCQMAIRMKNIFIKIPTPIVNHIFCSILLKISWFFEAILMVMCEYSMIVQTKSMKIIGFFNEIEQKQSSK